MRDEQPDFGIHNGDAAPDAAFDVAPELFDVAAAGGEQRRLADDAAR